MEDNKDTNVETKVEKETTIKTYTVDDINNSYNAGVKKATADLQKSEDYVNYLNWKKSNQNDGEKIKTLETDNATLKNEINQLKATIEMNKGNVKSEFAEFVMSKVMGMVNDKTDFGSALKQFKESSPQYFGDTVITKVESSPSLTGGQQPRTTNDIMNSILKSSRN